MSAILLLPRRQLTLTAEGSGKVVGVFGVDANAVKGVRKLVRASIRTGQLQFPRSLNRTPADKISLRDGACRAPCQGLAGVSVFGPNLRVFHLGLAALPDHFPSAQLDEIGAPLRDDLNPTKLARRNGLTAHQNAQTGRLSVMPGGTSPSSAFSLIISFSA